MNTSRTAICASCGERLVDRFCSRCGQNGRDLNRSLWVLLRELLAEAFELDSRLLRTLRGLWRPGYLTAEFCRGRRAAYTSPVRLYLVSSLVCFTLLALTGGDDAELAGGVDAGTSRAELVVTLADPEMRRLLAALSASDRQRFVDLQRRRGVDDAAALVEAAELDAIDATPEGVGERLLQAATSRALLFMDSPAAARAALLDNLPVASLVLLPLYALVLKLLYPGRFFIEHTVMSVHLHVVLLLVVGVAVLLPDTGFLAGVLDTLLWCVLLLYQLLALRTVYGGGWPSTVLRFGALTGAYLVLFLISAGALVLYTLTTFD